MEKEPKFGIIENNPESLADKINRLRQEVSSHEGKHFIMSEKFVSFVKNLKKKYPDYAKWLAYHSLIQSGMFEDETGVIEEDFPGDDSVVKFLESFLKKQV